MISPCFAGGRSALEQAEELGQGEDHGAVRIWKGVFRVAVIGERRPLPFAQVIEALFEQSRDGGGRMGDVGSPAA